MYSKFVTNASHAIPKARAARLFEALDKLDRAQSIDSIVRLMRK